MKLPKPEDLIIEPLNEDEITIAIDAIDQKTLIGHRNHVIFILMLDNRVLT